MLESVIVRKLPQGDGKSQIDLGLLAELMLFYQSVTIAANRAMLKQLIQGCGHDTLFELLESGYLKITFLDNALGINVEECNASFEKYHPIIYEIPRLGLQQIAPQYFIEATGRSGKGRRLARRFINLVDKGGFAPSVTDDIAQDFSDSEYISQSVICLLEYLVPEYQRPKTTKFKLHQDGKSLVAETNIDFKKVNDSYHKRIPSTHSTISVGYLLSHLFNVRGDLYLSALYESEIATDEVSSTIISLKFSDLLDKYNNGEAKIKAFKDFLFQDGKDVRGAINSGRRNFSDILSLLSKAKKFHGWIKGKEPNADLLKEYIKEITSDTWIDKLPAKTIRWSIFTSMGMCLDLLGTGGIGTTVGLLTSVADTFILDKLIKGWKPNQFVEGPLKNFLNQ